MDTKNAILLAAKEEFMSHGYSGSRMQRIADSADVNKGLIHYYFKTKSVLFKEVFLHTFRAAIPEIENIIGKSIPFQDKLKLFINLHIDIFRQNPHLPVFILSEINLKGEEFLISIFDEIKTDHFFDHIDTINKEFRIAYPKKNIVDFYINLFSLDIFPFILKPLLRHVVRFSEDELEEMWTRRKSIVGDMLILDLEHSKY